MRGILLVCVVLFGAFGPALGGTVGAAPPFVDVSPSDPAYAAINELAARGIIRGCDAAAGRFCPADPSMRAHNAALIARAMGWDREDHGNQFRDRCDPALGCFDDDLWRNVGTLQFYGVARGYDAATYGPHNNVLQQQVILFIARAMIARGVWARQPAAGTGYPNVPGGPDGEAIGTYVHYVGAVPDTTPGQTWRGYMQDASRAWFARALWQVIARYPVGPPPSTPPGGPTLGVSPSIGVAGTQFVASGRNFPAGSPVAWSIASAGTQTNSGSFQLDPGSSGFNFTIRTDGAPPGVYTVRFTGNGGAAASATFTITGSSLPPGWQQWRGLPLPGYFQYRSEGPSSSSPGCTVVVFYHHLSDGQIEGVRQQVREAWRQIGVISTRHQSYLLPHVDEYYGQNRSGLVAWMDSRASAIVDRSTVQIWDCPR